MSYRRLQRKSLELLFNCIAYNLWRADALFGGSPA